METLLSSFGEYTAGWIVVGILILMGILLTIGAVQEHRKDEERHDAGEY